MDSAPPADAARARHLQSGARMARNVGSLVWLLGSALCLALLIRSLVVQPFAIPSGSMMPGLEPGDIILVDKAAYGWSAASLPIPGLSFAGLQPDRVVARPVSRGDVVVFAGAAGQDFVKRVIGLPGDTVAMHQGRVQLNGVTLACLPAGNNLCREQLAHARDHLVLERGQGPLATMAARTVPPQHYFVLGDNRNESADSRVLRSAGGVGMVADGELLGRATHIIFSANNGAFQGIRWNRIGQRIG